MCHLTFMGPAFTSRCVDRDTGGQTSSASEVTDHKSDDNADDSCKLNYSHHTAFRRLNSLFTTPACSWQCGGHVFESPHVPAQGAPGPVESRTGNYIRSWMRTCSSTASLSCPANTRTNRSFPLRECSCICYPFNMQPDTLYHYTTVSGLEGILRSSSLYATHIAYLNDAEELKYGVKQISELLDPSFGPIEVVTSDRPAEYKTKILGVIERLRTEFISEHRQSLVKAPFVTCLSAMPDQLSQWHGYGQGGGYAIHFNPQLLERTVRLVGLEGRNEYGERYALEQITYDDDEAWDALGGILDRLVDAVCEQIGEPEDSSRDAISLSYEFSLIELEGAIARMKNPAFAEEQEFRIVAHPPEKRWYEGSCFHAGSGVGLVPRIILGFDPACITGVTVGPGEVMELRKQSLEHYFDAHREKYPDVEVELSGVPFRAI